MDSQNKAYINNILAYDNFRLMLEDLTKRLNNHGATLLTQGATTENENSSAEMEVDDTGNHTTPQPSSAIFTPNFHHHPTPAQNKRKADDAKLTDEDNQAKRLKTTHAKN